MLFTPWWCSSGSEIVDDNDEDSVFECKYFIKFSRYVNSTDNFTCDKDGLYTFTFEAKYYTMNKKHGLSCTMTAIVNKEREGSLVMPEAAM